MKLPRVGLVVGRALGLGTAALLTVTSSAEDADACVLCTYVVSPGRSFWTCTTYHGQGAGFYCEMDADSCATIGYCSG